MRYQCHCCRARAAWSPQSLRAREVWQPDLRDIRFHGAQYSKHAMMGRKKIAKTFPAPASVAAFITLSIDRVSGIAFDRSDRGQSLDTSADTEY